LDRWTKAAVIASTLAALTYETVNVGREFPQLPVLALLAFVLAFVAARFAPDEAAGGVMAFGCLVPVLFLAIHGHFRIWYLTPWKAALVGATAPTMTLTWRYPLRFRFALVAWSLAVAVTWPIVALRELDWTPSLLWVRPSTPSSAIHEVSLTYWIAQIAQVHLLGLLWMDWLFGRFSSENVRKLETAIVLPLTAFASIAALLAVYQGFFDLRFLSIGTWADLGRASGALADGNPSGVLSALCLPIPLGMIAVAGRRRWTVLAVAATVVLFLGVWSTGSRTALLTAVVGLCAIVHQITSISGKRIRPVAVAAMAVAGIAAGLLVVSPRVVGPIRRVSETLPNFTVAAARQTAWELWARGGYGLAAVAMIEDKPLQGVGIGAFHRLTGEYGTLVLGRPLPADNAQSWPRHQLAELGALGSIGCFVWIVLMIAVILRGRTGPDSRSNMLATKYAIAAFGLASLLGMPGQNVLVALTFCTLAAWLLVLVGANESTPSVSNRTTLWTSLAVALAVALAAMTARSGWRDLRPPFRAKRFDLPYRYGWYQPFEGASGQTHTSGHSVAVPQAPKKWLKLTVWVEHPDADDRPVRADVWIDHDRVVHSRFPRGLPLTRYVAVPGENRRFVIETTVDRTFLPAGHQYGEVGLTMEWEFVDDRSP
jgi:hypothetical protein